MDYTPTPQEYLTQKFSVIPVRTDGSKAPAIQWKDFQEKRATNEQITDWFSEAGAAIGVVTGSVSEDLTVLDFDNEAEEIFPRFREEIEDLCLGITDRFLIVQTPRPGFQVWFRQDGPVGRNQVLAYTEASPHKNEAEDSAGVSVAPPIPQVMIETRGEGGYVVAAGSPVEVHPNKTPYQIIHGSLEQLSPLTAHEVDTVLNLCRSYSRFTPQNVLRQSGNKYTGAPRPGDVFNQQTDLLQFLLSLGWSVDHETPDETVHLRRPGKSVHGSSATLGHIKDEDGRPLLYVFSSNATPFLSGQCYDAFSAFTCAEHKGDYSAAAVEARIRFAPELEEAQNLYFQSKSAEHVQGYEDQLPYKPFPIDCFPGVVRDYVNEHALAIGIDSAYIALPMLSVLAASIGGSRAIELKPGYTQPSIIWTVTVGSVSSGKSPGFDAAKQPLSSVQNSLHAVRKNNAANYEQQLTAYEQAKADGEKGIVKPKEQVSSEQVLINDITMEALAEVAETNSKLLLAVDEFAGFIKQLNQYRPGRDTENWLSLYDGRELNVNRKKDSQHIFVARTNISITGTTQPSVADETIYNEKFLGNGLAARILSARPPSVIVRWSEKQVQDSTHQAMKGLVERLYLLDGDADHLGPCPKILKCTPEAKQLFVEWMNSSADEAESLDENLRNSLCKIIPVAARLALVLSVTRQILDSPQHKAMSPVGVESMQAGITLAKWFSYEVRRNALVGEAHVLHQHFLWVLKNHPNGIDARLLQMGRRKIATAEKSRRVLDSLADHGFGELIDQRFIPYS
ncbi:MAG: DUF3987 domain-containing protein [Pirellulales bacterium]